MKDKTDSKKDGSRKKKTQQIGTIGGLYGHTVCAVLRRLGKEGLSIQYTKAIMAAKKVKVNDTRISIQVCAGRNKDEERGKVAPLTAAQLAEQVHAAQDPARDKAVA